MNKIIVVSGARGIGDLIYQLPLLRSLYLTYKTKLIIISNEVNKSKEVYKYEDFYNEIINFDNTRYSIFKTFSKIKSFLNLLNKYESDLLILTSTARDLKDLSQNSIEDLLNQEKKKLDDNNSSDKERYLSSYKISTLKEISQ